MQTQIPLGSRVRIALQRGPLQGLSSPAVERMVAAGVVQQLGHGQVQAAWRTGPTVVVDGLVRVWTRTPEGREWTIRYVESGGTIHFAPGGETETGVQLQALRESLLLVIDRGLLQRWMGLDAELATAVARAAGRELTSTLNEVTRTALRPLRIRICNHLLYLAGTWPERDGRLPLTHHDLASAVGSVRDVVTRTLDELEAAGAIELRRGMIVVSDVARLRALRDTRVISVGPAPRPAVVSVT